MGGKTHKIKGKNRKHSKNNKSFDLAKDVARSYSGPLLSLGPNYPLDHLSTFLMVSI